MFDKSQAMVLGSFVADSLALGAHGIYDPAEIKERFGPIQTLTTPLPESCHRGKSRGDQTHYGDQALVLLESLADQGGFDAGDFFRRWRELFLGGSVYVDKATQGTLECYESRQDALGCGSPFDELGGAARIAPLVHACGNDLAQLVDAARLQTTMTHTGAGTVAAAEFFARVARQVLEGVRPVAAIIEVTMHRFRGTAVERWVETGMASRNTASVEAISRLGAGCATSQGFTGVIHLLTRYENSFAEALVQNTLAGGDSAARGMLAGMVLGAHLGMDAIPAEWCESLLRADHITALLQTEQRS